MITSSIQPHSPIQHLRRGAPFFNLPRGAKTPSSVCTPGVCHPGYATDFFPNLFLFCFCFFDLVFVLIWIICRASGLEINLTLFNFSSMFRPRSGSKLQNQLSCNFKLVYILTLISDRGDPMGPYHRFFLFCFVLFCFLFFLHILLLSHSNF